MKKLVFVLGVALFGVVMEAKAQVVINELYYDAPGTDAGFEWIELYNSDSESVDISGWNIEKAGDNFKTVFSFTDGSTIEAGKYVVVGEDLVEGADYKTKLAFENGGTTTDGVRLVKKDGQIADVLLYDSPNSNNLFDVTNVPGTTFAPKVASGHSLGRMPDGAGATSADFYDLTSPTLGKANEMSPTPTPSATPTPTASPTSTPDEEDEEDDWDKVEPVLINEIMPDPVGKDSGSEWVELYNSGTGDVDLGEFYIDDVEGGSLPHKLPENTIVKSHSYLVFKTSEIKISLNNSGDKVRLLYPDKSVVLEVEYDKVPKEGYACARNENGDYEWTAKPTEGKKNEFFLPTPTPVSTAKVKKTTSVRTGTVKSVSAVKQQIVDDVDENVSVSQKKQNKNNYLQKEPREIKVNESRDMPVGELVTLEDTVLVEPGKLDSHIFYLVNARVGVVFLFDDRPVLSPGDFVKITGVIQVLKNEKFLVVTKSQDIQKVKPGVAPEPKKVSIDDITNDKVGSLVSFSGSVQKTNKNELIIFDKEKTIRVIKIVNNKDVGLGSKITVTGIISIDNQGTRILPLSVEVVSDIKKTQQKYVNKMGHPKRVASLVCFGGAIFLLVMKLMYKKPVW